jgi:hypothetical protein
MSIPASSTYIGLRANAIHDCANRLHGEPKDADSNKRQVQTAKFSRALNAQ